ncbi:MAG: hypothetical protein WCB04_09245 [Mycobacteriales bacterium]
MRASIIALAALTAFAVMLLSPSKGEASSTHTVTFDALGGNKGNVTVNAGDTVRFVNALPLAPLTGAVVPVAVTFGTDHFSVAGTPVDRTITQSVAYSGTYAVAGLVPTTTSSGSFTTTSGPAQKPPPGGQNPPPANGGGGSGGSGGGTGSGSGGGTGTGVGAGSGGGAPQGPAGDSGYVPGGAGSATGPQLGGGTANGGTGAGQVPPPLVDPNHNTSLVPGNGTAGKQRAINNASATAGGLGLTALLGAILLLGVGIALARTLISGRLNSATTTA